jgi:hypothetical protein
MSLTKRYLEDVAEELGVEDIMDPAVLAEAQRRLDVLGVGELSLAECITNGTHLTDCDDDGYCNYCGEQDPWDALVEKETRERDLE